VKRVLLWIAVLLVVFLFGTFTGNYKTFPWTAMQPAGQQVAMLLRSAGVLPPLPEPPEETEPTPVPERTVEAVETVLVNFDLTTVNNAEPLDGAGGGMAVTPGGILIAKRRDGVLAFYDRQADVVRELPLRLPPLPTLPERFESGRRVPSFYMRYHDVEVVPRADGDHLYVSYNHYDPERVCFSMRLEEALLPAGWETAANRTLEWQAVLDTRPCLPPSLDRNLFGGNQAGGRIVAAPDGGIFFTTGDFEFDGIGRKTPKVSQIADSSYGRIFSIAPAGQVTELVRGLRNPQGLVLDDENRMWITDQSARGGDELDLIVTGRNYGWPEVNLGVQYTNADNDSKSWPFNDRQGYHDGYEPPRYAWIPSVAPATIALVSNLTPRWDGDLLVGTLVTQGLRRLRLEGDHVLFDEPIPLKRRVRDLAVTDGRIYILFDDGRFGYLVPHAMQDRDPADGHTTTALTDLGCLGCHANPAMPRLPLVYSEDIAAQADITYSEALGKIEGIWTKESLASFLKSPSTFAPGTAMPDFDLSDDQIATLIDELWTIKQRP
jgi:cytochrome c2